MHYTGMIAVILVGTIHYDRVLVAASILVAILGGTQFERDPLAFLNLAAHEATGAMLRLERSLCSVRNR